MDFLYDRKRPLSRPAGEGFDTPISLSDAAMKLADFPDLGRAGAIPGTRELIPHSSYRLVYEIEQDTLWILALIHTSRQWPPLREGRSIS
jgi:hypothetical protein